MPLLEQWLEAKGITEPTLEDIVEAMDEMEDYEEE